jgi:hypothetical protein
MKAEYREAPQSDEEARLALERFHKVGFYNVLVLHRCALFGCGL